MKVKLFYVMLLLPLIATAQIKGLVKDSLTGKPIPYVVISSSDNRFGANTNQDGSFSIATSDASGGVGFAVTGYREKVVRKLANGQEILLQKLPERPRTRAILKRTEIKSSGKIPEDYDPTQTSSFFTKPAILAKYFPYEARYKEAPYLSSVIVNVLSKKDEAIYKIRIFEVGDDGKPGQDVLNEDILVRTKSGDHNAKIDMSQYGIRFSEKGFFIGVETIMVDENLAKVTWKTDNNDPESAVRKEVYQPTFRGNSVRSGTLWRFYNNKWTHLQEKEQRKTTKGKYYPMNNLYLEIELSN